MLETLYCRHARTREKQNTRSNSPRLALVGFTELQHDWVAHQGNARGIVYMDVCARALALEKKRKRKSLDVAPSREPPYEHRTRARARANCVRMCMRARLTVSRRYIYIYIYRGMCICIYIYIYIYHAISYLDNAPRPREYREIIQLSAYRKSRNLRAFIYIHVTGHTQRRRPRLSSSRVVEH